MYRILCIISCLVCCCSYRLEAQQACSDPGISISAVAESGNAVYAAGDMTLQAGGQDPANPNTADWYFTPAAQVRVMAAVTISPGAVLRLKAGAVLEVYGNFTNNGYLFVEPGARIFFYGQTWANDTTAVVGDGLLAGNTTPGGTISFVAPRPVINASVGASACVMNNYSGGDFVQSLDGGNVPMDIVLRIANANNIQLMHTATRMEGKIDFAVPEGDILLQDQDLVFEANAAYSWSIPDAKDAYLVTSDTASCKGMVHKRGITRGHNFVFPVGRYETFPTGQRDFCPVVVQNDSADAEDIKVAVKTYAEAQAAGVVTGTPPQATSDHLWQIISTYGSGLTLNMLHHVTAGGNDLNLIFNQQTGYAPVSQYTSNVVWVSGDGPRGLGNGQGSLGGIIMADDGYAVAISQSSCSHPFAWFRKEEADTAGLLHFWPERDGCTILLHADLLQVLPWSHIEVERKADSTHAVYEPLGPMLSEKMYHYRFTDQTPVQGTNQYRLKLYFNDTFFLYSNEVIKDIDCSSITVFPNPAGEYVYLNGLVPGQIIQLYTIEGRLLLQQKALKVCEQIDMRPYASGNYIITVWEDNRKIAVKKLTRLSR